MSLGTLLVGAWSGGSLLASSRTTALQLHLGLALVGWIGGLLTAVSWQVLPMFYLTPGVAPARSWLVLLALAASTAGAALVIVLESAGQLAGAGGTVGLVLLAPGALALGVVHPLLVLSDLRRRRRRRVDVSFRAWQVAMGLAPVCLGLACAAALAGSERLGMAFVWCALMGWAGLVVHGMLTRIAPFLLWWHRFSPLVGTVPVPAMGRLLSAKLVSFGLVVHGAVVVVGLLAIAVGGDAPARITGGGLVLLGGILLSHLVTLLRLRPTASDPIGRVAGAEAPELEVGAA